MPRRLENDRWLFGVTLALCLLGAVMIYSASAVTADQQYGRSYIFLLRQAAWLLLGLLGMFALMRTDYRRLREPAVVYHDHLPRSADARRHVFPGQIARHASLDQASARSAFSRRSWPSWRSFFIWRGFWI